MFKYSLFFFFFFFNDTATTEIYTLSLHDALPISRDHFPATLRDFNEYVRAMIAEGAVRVEPRAADLARLVVRPRVRLLPGDRKSTRLNSSHLVISYAVFCLKKKKKERIQNVYHVT